MIIPVQFEIFFCIWTDPTLPSHGVKSVGPRYITSSLRDSLYVSIKFDDFVMHCFAGIYFFGTRLQAENCVDVQKELIVGLRDGGI